MTKPKYLNIHYVDAAEGIDYNGKECNIIDNVFPLGKIVTDGIYDFNVQFTIDIEEGKILDWPIGNTAVIYSKPVDSGIYTFKDTNKKDMLVYSGYVPDGLAIDSDGYGDYIILSINENGLIKNWDKKRILNVYKYIKHNLNECDVV